MATPKMRTAALYARFSSDLQKDRSIDDQFAVCETYAKREGIKVIAKFNDRAKSGASFFDRDGLMDLRNAAKRKEFDAIIVESLDRLSRDQEDLAGLFKRLTHYGVDILTVNEGVTTAIHVGVRGIVGSMFLKDLAQKVKRGQSGQVNEGKIPGSLAYGYDCVPNSPGERKINEDEARTVRRIFKEYSEGMSPREIANGLSRDGIPTPVGGKHWNHQGFANGESSGLLSNRLYIGELVWNKRRFVKDPESGARQSRLMDQSDHIVIPMPHLRIIDQKLWDAAQAVREQRAIAKFGPTMKAVQRGTPRNRDSFLAGLLVCGSCYGHMRISVTGRDGDTRVACAAAYSRQSCQHRKSYHVAKLEAGVLAGFKSHLLDPEPIKEAVKAYHERYRQNEKEHGAERQVAEKQYNRLTLQIDRIVAAISDSETPLPALLESLKKKEAERVGLQERIRLLQGVNIVALHPNVIEDYKANVTKLHKALTSNAADPQIKMAFKNLIDSIVVHPTAKRMPYEFSVFGRLAAMMGVDLFPSIRSTSEIVAAEALPATSIPSISGARSGRYRNNAPGVISLGRWRSAA